MRDCNLQQTREQLRLTRLLREAKEQNTAAEERLAFEHDWQDWYSAYITGRVYGLSIKEANNAADDDVAAAHAARLS